MESNTTESGNTKQPIVSDSDSNLGIANDSDRVSAITESANSGSGSESETASDGIGSASGHDQPRDVEPIARPARSRARTGSSGGSSGTSSGKSTARQAQAKLDLSKSGKSTLALQVKGVHEIIGLLTGFGEICHITEDEADGLTQAVLDVMAQYKIKPNPKVVAWSNLAGIAAVIYAPKIWLIMEARKLQKPQAAVRQEPARNVSPIASGGNAAPGMMKFS